MKNNSPHTPAANHGTPITRQGSLNAPTFLLAHLPTSDIDRRILDATTLLEGRPLTHPTVTKLRRRAIIRKTTHLPAIIVTAISALVVMDLSASGADPFNTWPLEATLAVITGWIALLTYLATFKAPMDKAFSRCAVIPISTLEPELPRLLSADENAIGRLMQTLRTPGIIEDSTLNYEAARTHLARLTASLR